MQLSDVSRRLNLTYRKADHWATSGYIKTHYEDRAGNRVTDEYAGSGFVRVIAPKEIEVLRLMVDLVNAGVTPSRAATHARRLLRGKDVPIGREITMTRSGR